MASTVVAAASLVLVVVILASILGAVGRRERFLFVGGIALFIGAHVVPGIEAVGVGVAVLGLILAAASAIPLLREPV